MKQTVERIGECWAAILEWISTPPKTIRHDLDAGRIALAGEIAGAVAAMRTELEGLRSSETKEQRSARKRRQRKLAKTTKLLPLRMWIGDLKLEPPSIDEPKNSEQCLLDVERLSWSGRTPHVDKLLAEIDATPKPKSPSRYVKPGEYVPSDKRGITNFDIFNVFGLDVQTILTGEEIGEALGDMSRAPIELGACKHCSRDDVPAWRRGGRIVERFWPDGRRDFGCHFCGRAVKEPIWRMIHSKNGTDTDQEAPLIEYSRLIGVEK